MWAHVADDENLSHALFLTDNHPWRLIDRAEARAQTLLSCCSILSGGCVYSVSCIIDNLCCVSGFFCRTVKAEDHHMMIMEIKEGAIQSVLDTECIYRQTKEFVCSSLRGIIYMQP